MALVFKAIRNDEIDTNKLNKSTDESNESDGMYEKSILSSNLEKLRNDIKEYMKYNVDKVIHSNVFRFILPVEDENEIPKMLDEYMQKEIKSLKLCNIEQFEQLEFNTMENINTVKPNVGYLINNVNINTVQFLNFIDDLSCRFENVWLVKCEIDDCYTERLVLICENDNKVVNKSKLPINEEELINFLYALYSRALFILKSTDDEFKKIVQYSVKVLNNVKLF